MISRRDLLVGGLCAGGMAAAAAMVPRTIMASHRKVTLEKAIPKAIGPWQQIEAASNVLPKDENSLSAQLYSQLVSRVYSAEGRDAVMMVIAYGDSQSDTLQLHRPEVCYEAAGFKIIRSEPVSFDAGLKAPVTGRYVVAQAAYRTEAILYWTRIGDALPVSRFDQQMSKLQAGLEGVVPDGTLSRLSVLVDADQSIPESLTDFAVDLLKVVSAPAREALVGARVGG